jgi:hypothetical protein
MNLITKADFTPDLVEFTQNTPDHKVNPAIYKAISIDLKDALPRALYLDILLAVQPMNTLLAGKRLEEWKANSNYQINAYCFTGNAIFENGKVYKCLSANVNSVPTAENANWQYDDLLTFFAFYVKPYVVLSAYVRFLFVSNVDQTPTGLREFKENESVAINQKVQGELINSHKKDQSRLLAEMLNHLTERKYIVAGTTYSRLSTNPKKTGYSGNINAI